MDEDSWAGYCRKKGSDRVVVDGEVGGASTCGMEIAERMGDRHEYYGHGVVAKKWARVHWEVNKDLLLDELSREALDYCKEVVLTKTKLDQAVKAGYLPPRLYDRAVKREQLGWNVNLKILEPPEGALDWKGEEER